MAKGSTPETECILRVLKGMNWVQHRGFLRFLIWSIAIVIGSGSTRIWVRRAMTQKVHPGVKSCTFKLMAVSDRVRINDEWAVHERRVQLLIM